VFVCFLDRLCAVKRVQLFHADILSLHFLQILFGLGPTKAGPSGVTSDIGWLVSNFLVTGRPTGFGECARERERQRERQRERERERERERACVCVCVCMSLLACVYAGFCKSLKLLSVHALTTLTGAAVPVAPKAADGKRIVAI
jgi:hypothetical protein